MAKQSSNNKLLLSYAGLAMQLMVGLGLCVYIGILLDKWVKPGMPLFAWVLPLILIAASMYRVIKDTSKKKNDV